LASQLPSQPMQPFAIVRRGINPPAAYQLAGRQGAALFKARDTSCRAKTWQLPSDPPIPGWWQLQAPWQISPSHITIAGDRFH